jgi:hypothetical protein
MGPAAGLASRRTTARSVTPGLTGPAGRHSRDRSPGIRGMRAPRRSPASQRSRPQPVLPQPAPGPPGPARRPVRRQPCHPRWRASYPERRAEAGVARSGDYATIRGQEAADLAGDLGGAARLTDRVGGVGVGLTVVLVDRSGRTDSIQRHQGRRSGGGCDTAGQDLVHHVHFLQLLFTRHLGCRFPRYRCYQHRACANRHAGADIGT